MLAPMASSSQFDSVLGVRQGECLSPFLPEASFGLRVLSLPASVCVSVRPCVR